MKHILFPTASAADAFIAEMQQKGMNMGQSTYTRRSETVVEGGGTPEDAAAGAVKGTGIGAVAGAATGFLGTAAAIAAGVATGGLAIPVMLGLGALGAGVGATVGAVGGAMGVDETGDDYYETSDTYYDRLNATVSGGGRVIAVADSVPADVLDAAARHGGEVTDAGNEVSRYTRPAGTVAGAAGNVASAAGNVAGAVGNKVEELADRARAAGHEVAGAVTGNPKHDALAAEDRAKAEMNNAQAHTDLNEAKRDV